MKINTHIKTLFFGLFLLWSGVGTEAFAQSYPVHLTTQLVAPFSGYLPDYANTGEEKLKVLVLFTDYTKPSYTIKLKLSIQGQGINIQSKSYYFEGPFTVQPGVPLEISGTELYGLLNSQNLDFNGLNKTTYEQRKVLPEGFYTFCVTAYDYNNPIPIQVSNNSCTQAWMVLSDPPFLNLPQCGSTVTTLNPQQQIFSFTQMNMGSPNSAANTEYVFELWEVRPQGAVPNNIVTTTPPIYSYTTNLTTINYGITEPPLLLGMQYVWRVKAVDITGRDLFKNQGYSQICTFTYGNVLDGADINLNLHGQAISQRQIKVWWDSLSVFTNYNVEFRKLGSSGNWYPVTTSHHSLRILDLEPQTTYEIHVQGVSSDYTSPFSQTVNITTLPLPNYQCGEMPIVPNSSQFQPLTLANTNMVWQVGQFEMKITQLQNVASGSGIYSGLGKIRMPFAGMVNCKFTNVTVNSDQIVVGGKVVALTEGVDAWVNDGGVGTIQDGTEEPEIQVGTPITMGDINVSTSNGTFTIGGNTYTYTPAGSTIEDSNGNLYIVTADGQVIYAGTSGTGNGPVPESKNIINTAKGKINFKPNATQLYGMDEYSHPELANYYLTVKNVTDNTHPPVNWKSVMAQKYDVIDLDYQLMPTLKADSILFRTGVGTIYKPQGSGTSRKLYIIGGKHGDVQELFACYKVRPDSFVNIAKINIVSYKNEQNKVTLVPLGTGISIDKTQLQKQLNDIYKQSVASWVVDVAPAITVGDTMWDKDNNGHFNVGSNMFSRYSNEMKAVNRYLRNQPYYGASDYYLIVTNKPTDSLSTDIQGEMPRGRNIGYLFTSTPTATLVAHELAHGAFALEHSFDGNATLPKGTSTCLMDYNHGTELYKGKYWDYVHKPVAVIGLLDGDDDGAMVSPYTQICKLLSEIKEQSKKGGAISLRNYKSYLSAQQICIYGVNMTEISVFLLPQYGDAITPKNNIQYSLFDRGYPYSVNNKTKCIDIEGKVKIFAIDTTQLKLLKSYLMDSYPSKNLLVFVNGYRNNAPSLIENPKPADEVATTDFNGYWKGIDALFINRIGTRNVVYADGHHSVSTSNHRGQGAFLTNLSEWECASSLTATLYSGLLNHNLPFACLLYYHNDSLFDLHTNANTGGFAIRRNNGFKAGNDLINQINNGTITFDINRDSIDIVSHSMGYAYALGIIDAFRANPKKFKFGRFYNLAPENACSGGTDFSIFEEVWQYGSKETTPTQKGDATWEQDGVASQCPIPDIESSKYPKTKHGRIYFPDYANPKKYLECHYAVSYGWIFSKTNNDAGYVKPRK